MTAFRLRRHRKDTNHAAIAEVFAAAGWSTWDVSQNGVVGSPDLLVSKGGRTVAIEIKAGPRDLRAAQTAWLQAWQGEWLVLRSVSDAQALVGAR